MNRWRPLLIAFAFGTPASPRATSAAESRPEERRSSTALGVNVDVLPTALSAANARVGYAPQVWLGIDHVRLRAVLSHLEPPDAFALAPSGFHHPTTTAIAAIADYTFGPRFDRWWVGSGLELWEQSIGHDGVTGSASWTSAVFTVGGGYIWRFAGDFFVDPWVGAHLVMNPQTVSLDGFDYRPFPLQGELSVKIGWFTPL